MGGRGVGDVVIGRTISLLSSVGKALNLQACGAVGSSPASSTHFPPVYSTSQSADYSWCNKVDW